MRYKSAMSLPTAVDVPQELAAATARWRKLRRLAAYGAVDGWSLAIFGALTLICGGYGSAAGLMVSFALLGSGIFEIYTVRQLRRLNPSAVIRMASNQLVLAAALILYGLINLFQSRHGGGLPAEIQQALAQAGASGGDANDQVSDIMQVFYLILIAFALLVQGGTALYYLSRRKHLQRYLEQTPDWIQQMQRERGEVSL